MDKKPGFLRKVFGSRYARFFYSTRKRKIVFGILGVLLILYFVNNSMKPDFETDLYVVESQTLVEKVTAPGEVKADKSIGLAFLQPGRIDDIFVLDGTIVSEGERIASIDTTKLYQSYLSADAALRNTKASLDSTYDTLQGHDDDETFAQIASRTTSETTKDQAYRSLVIAQKSLSEGTMTAPFGGIVNYIEGVSIGSYASAITPSFALVDPGTVYFEAKVNEVDVANVSVNAKAVVELDAYPDEIFDQQVQSVGFIKTITSSGGTAYRVRVSLPQNIHNRFRLGMNGDVDFIINKSDGVITIPISAVVEEDDMNYVWVVNGGGKVSRIEVEVGASSIDDVEIISGLAEGDVIVQRPPSKIVEGNKVKSENGIDTPGNPLQSIF
ncbi:efflux RND transporter periplasmic adaptor subunit [Patescibacteria group bacterium]